MARPDDRFLSMLPLSHMFERTGGYYLPLSLGATGRLSRAASRRSPTISRRRRRPSIFAVPRIFERFGHASTRRCRSRRVKRALFDACVARGYRVARGEASLARPVLAPALRRARREADPARSSAAACGSRWSAARALDPALARTFIGLGLPLLQGYGMTEASPVISVNRDDDNDPESVGPPLPGVEVKLADDGELLARGDNVMLGYWRNAEATRAAIDADGWLHTGDLAEIRDGKIYIRGRAKDVIVMSNGEKLPPQDVELAILHDPVFEQVMLVGEGRPFPMLLAVTQETDEKALHPPGQRSAEGLPALGARAARDRDARAWSVDNGLPRRR